MTDEHDAKTFFDAIARRYDRVYALSGSSSRERLARVLAAIEGKRRVLVLGLGTGRELPALLDRGHEVTGLDVSPKMIALCNTRSRTVPTVEADFWQPLPFAEGLVRRHPRPTRNARPSACGRFTPSPGGRSEARLGEGRRARRRASVESRARTTRGGRAGVRGAYRDHRRHVVHPS